MSIDTATPRTRRAILAGAFGGLLASAASFARAPEARAGVDGDLVLEATNNTDAQTELIANTSSAGFRVLGTAIALQGWGDIGVDAYGETIGLNAIGDGNASPAGVAWNRANSLGQLGWSTDGAASTPTVPAKTGVYGIAEQDADARGVFGKSTSGQGVRGEATTGIGVLGYSEDSVGVLGVGPLGLVPDPVGVTPGVYGSANLEPGVFGYSSEGYGVRGDSTGGDGVYGQANASWSGTDQHIDDGHVAGVHGHGGWAGVLGTNGDGGFGVQALSTDIPAVYARNTSAVNAAIVAEGGPGTAIHGHANDGGENQINIPHSPALTGIFGSATDTGEAIAAISESGLALRAQSTLGDAVRARGKLDGVIGESTGGRSGVVGFSGAGTAPAGFPKTGVFGTSMDDGAGRGVYGKAGPGLGVRGYAATGTGGYFGTSGPKVGLALRTVGKVRFEKCVGIATVAAGANSVVVTPGIDVGSATAVVATLQGNAGAGVVVQRGDVDTANDRFTIRLTGNAAASVKVAWHAFG